MSQNKNIAETQAIIPLNFLESKLLRNSIHFLACFSFIIVCTKNALPKA